MFKKLIILIFAIALFSSGVYTKDYLSSSCFDNLTSTDSLPSLFNYRNISFLEKTRWCLVNKLVGNESIIMNVALYKKDDYIKVYSMNGMFGNIKYSYKNVLLSYTNILDKQGAYTYSIQQEDSCNNYVITGCAKDRKL